MLFYVISENTLVKGNGALEHAEFMICKYNSAGLYAKRIIALSNEA